MSPNLRSATSVPYATGLPGRSVPTIFPFSCSALLISALAYKSHIIVLSIPATKTTSKPRSDALINGTAEICMTSTSLAIRAGRARVEDMEIISTSSPSLANPPVSFAIHIEAMVPDVNK